MQRMKAGHRSHLDLENPLDQEHGNLLFDIAKHKGSNNGFDLLTAKMSRLIALCKNLSLYMKIIVANMLLWSSF
nr:hypothetical protein Itr_chr13CG18900 [Ipomoea trifida]